MTREQKAKWLARLRDPNSVQMRGSYSDDVLQVDLSALPMCCIAQGQYAISGSLHCTNDFDIFQEIKKEKNTLVEMNDIEMKSLSEIADWIEANVHTS